MKMYAQFVIKLIMLMSINQGCVDQVKGTLPNIDRYIQINFIIFYVIHEPSPLT